MRTQHLLLLSSIVLSSPVLAADPKPAANADGKPGAEAISRADAARSTGANDEMMQDRPSRKDRVPYTFSPAAKRM
jgi:hypothetical protein